MKFCPHCGMKLDSQGSRFCQECGKELRAPSQEPPQQPDNPAVETGFPRVTEEPVLSTAPPLTFSEKFAAALLPVSVPTTGPMSPWFWVGCVVLALSFWSWLWPAFGGYPTRGSGSVGLGIVVVVGYMSAYLFRRSGRRRNIGFAFGVVMSLMVLWCLRVSLGGAFLMGVVPGSSTVPSPTSGEQVLRDPKGWTEESTGSAEIGPWLKASPNGTRFYRDIGGIIYRLYPPGVKPDAAPANPFDFTDSTPEPLAR